MTRFDRVASESSESGEVAEQCVASDHQSDVNEDEIELEIQDEKAFLEALGQLAPGVRGVQRPQRLPGTRDSRDTSPTPFERAQLGINLTVASAAALSAAPPLPFVPAEIALTLSLKVICIETVTNGISLQLPASRNKKDKSNEET